MGHIYYSNWHLLSSICIFSGALSIALTIFAKNTHTLWNQQEMSLKENNNEDSRMANWPRDSAMPSCSWALWALPAVFLDLHPLVGRCWDRGKKVPFWDTALLSAVVLWSTGHLRVTLTPGLLTIWQLWSSLGCLHVTWVFLVKEEFRIELHTLFQTEGPQVERTF